MVIVIIIIIIIVLRYELVLPQLLKQLGSCSLVIPIVVYTWA